MLRYDIAKKWRKALVFGAGICTISYTFISAGLQAESNTYANPIYNYTVQFIHNYGFIINPILLALISLFSWANLYIGQKHSWRTIEAILEEQRNLLFGKLNDPEHNHKVTLFMWKQILWFKPWTWRVGGYLVPVARFGERSRNNIPNFKAPINNPGLAEGVAGLGWQHKKPVHKFNLPNLNETQPSNTQFETYAKETNMGVKWVKKRWIADQRNKRSTALSYAVWRIKASGKVWGVLVIDSTIPAKIIPKPADNKVFKAYLELITRALEETDK